MWWPFRRKKQPIEVINRATVITIPGDKVKVTLVEAKYFKPKDLAKLKLALVVLSKVVNSEEFKKRVLTYRSPLDSYPGFTSCDEFRGSVYDKIINANELNSGDDKEIDLSLKYYNRWWSKVVGYTLPSSLWIWMNWKYHLHFTPSQMAGNLAHEYCHKLGYSHKSASEHTSVPYAIGHIVEELGLQFEHNQHFYQTEVHVDQM